MINSTESDYSEWIWRQVCERQFEIYSPKKLLLLPSWCSENDGAAKVDDNDKDFKEDQSEELLNNLQQINDWKMYCKKLVKVFNVEGTSHEMLEGGVLNFNMRETLWSNRELYNLENYSNFQVSFDFFLETGDSEMRVAFSENKDEEDSLVFRISGESDMTGTFLQKTHEEESYFYKDYSPITYGVWNHIEFNFISENSLDIVINGKSLNGIMVPIIISKRGFIGFVKSDYRFDKLFIRNFKGSFRGRPIVQ